MTDTMTGYTPGTAEPGSYRHHHHEALATLDTANDLVEPGACIAAAQVFATLAQAAASDRLNASRLRRRLRRHANRRTPERTDLT